MINAENWLGLDDSHICSINGNQGLQQTAKDAFCKMQEAAQQAHIDLQIASSFRSFERQLHIWQLKWTGKRTLYDLHGKPLEFFNLTDEQRLHAILTWSALPGASRHHWGSDLDVYDKSAVDRVGHQLELVASEYQQGGPCFALSCWLEQNADRFGFYRPYEKYNGGVATEPWHISYRPLADEIINQLDLEKLRGLITVSEIGGKELILSQLDQLYSRYTLNGIQV